MLAVREVSTIANRVQNTGERLGEVTLVLVIRIEALPTKTTVFRTVKSEQTPTRNKKPSILTGCPFHFFAFLSTCLVEGVRGAAPSGWPT